MIEPSVAIPTIEKEKIEGLHFPPEEVLLGKEKIVERKSELTKAMRLGTMFKDKVKIIFEDTEGMKTVETAIWGVTEKNVILKKGIVIPLHRVHQLAM